MSREQIQARAVVLRAVDYGENDRILTLLLEGLGKRSAIAKGGKSSKKRFAGALENFRVSRFTFTDRGPDKMLLLAEASVVEDFPGVESSFEKISMTSFATELTRELLQDAEGGELLFAALVAHYRQASASEDALVRLEADLTTYVLRALSLAGYGPSLTRCVRTGRPLVESDTWRFLLTGQGIIHPSQRRQGERTVESTREVFEEMYRLAGGYVERLPAPTLLRCMRPMLQGMVHSAVGKELRSGEFLRMVMEQG